MRKQRALLFAVVVVMSFPMAAQSKGPWEWSLDERLAARLDPQSIADRDRQYEIDYAEQLSRSKPEQREHPSGNLSYRIDGRRNPELILPHELFDVFMNAFTPDAARRSNYRAFLRPKLQESGFSDLDWSRVEPELSHYALLQQEYVQHTRQIQPDERCKARFGALESARASYGREKFDRMLYEVIAPEFQTSHGLGSSAGRADALQQHIRLLRDAETGCAAAR